MTSGIEEAGRAAASAVEESAPAGMRRRDELGLRPGDLAALAATVWLAAVIPLDLVLGPFGSVPLRVASVVVSVILAADVAARLTRPIVVHGIPIIDHAEIRRRYLRGWFWVDAVAVIPFALIAEMPGLAGTDAGQVLRVIGLVRVLRLARVIVLQREWRVRASFNPAVLRLSFFFFWIVLFAHWIACGFIQLTGGDLGFADVHPYQESLYWSITTLTTVGYGDITPNRAGEMAYTMAVMALGAAMYGYIIGNVASLLANIDVLRSRHLGRLENVNHYMRDRAVPRELQARVREYYNYLWESRMSRQSDLLDDLPKPLRTEIALHVNRNVLRKVPLFEKADESLLRELVINLQPTVSVPGEAIVRRGEIGHRIFFINSGRVEVLGTDEREVIATLDAGSFFGEMALLLSQPRSNTVRAIDYCNLYTLDRDRFNQVLENFPEFAAGVHEIADARRAELSEPDP